jgi:hypothetical protein
MSQLWTVLFLSLIFTGSLLMIIGTKYRWRFLVDPPERWSPYYAHSFLKKCFGSRFLVVYNYVVGTVLASLSAIFLIVVLAK